VSKSAVIGMARRCGLPARPSPIIRNGAPQPPRPPQPLRAGSVTLPPLASAIVLEAARKPRQAPPAPAPVSQPPAAPRHPQAPRSGRTCVWIEGLPRGAATVFCDAPAQPGSVYCAAHHARAYT
jgi:GcrA cell cycle regulator